MVGGTAVLARGPVQPRHPVARCEPGSAFKPLYYSAAIDSRKFTPATMILDAPVVFTNADGTLYEPLNYKGQWHGRVLLRDALAESMNVPVPEGPRRHRLRRGHPAGQPDAGRHGPGGDRHAASRATTPSAWASSPSPRWRWRAHTPCSPTAAARWCPWPSATSRTATERSSWSRPRKPWRRRAARATRRRS